MAPFQIWSLNGKQSDQELFACGFQFLPEDTVTSEDKVAVSENEKTCLVNKAGQGEETGKSGLEIQVIKFNTQGLKK